MVKHRVPSKQKRRWWILWVVKSVKGWRSGKSLPLFSKSYNVNIPCKTGLTAKQVEYLYNKCKMKWCIVYFLTSLALAIDTLMCTHWCLGAPWPLTKVQEGGSFVYSVLLAINSQCVISSLGMTHSNRQPHEIHHIY